MVGRSPSPFKMERGPGGEASSDSYPSLIVKLHQYAPTANHPFVY
jgi:hypothetical protein